MELTEQQKKGLDTVVARYKGGYKYSVISGYAGSGKSTLVKFIVAALDVPEEDIVYACFTGKACNVLQQKGCKNVSTLHRLLYEFRPLVNGGFRRIPKRRLDYKLVIVDECSMASNELIEQLFRHQVHIICLGDPFQLPPINPEDDNHLLDSPHVFLSEIHRQAQESDIIKISMDIRAGRSLMPLDGNDIKIYNKEHLCTDMMLWADQILCAKNETRIALNNQMRALMGHEGTPQNGDKVICLRNYWEELDSNGDPLVNGTIGYLQNAYETTVPLPPYFSRRQLEVICADVVTETGSTFKDLILDKRLILEGQKSLTREEEIVLRKNQQLSWILPTEFTYGYAVTCHKAQGSQWDKVLVLEESFPFAREEHQRWLYTACTRAAERLVIVRK